VGLAKAVELGLAELDSQAQRLERLRDQLWRSLQVLDGLYLNGHPLQRLPGNLNFSIAGVDGQALLLGLQPLVAVSSGAACSSAKVAPSHVLKALGHSDELAYASLRLGLGRFNTQEEIDQVAQAIVATVQSLQRLPDTVNINPAMNAASPLL